MKIAIFHTMALGDMSAVGGVQKVIVNSCLAFDEHDTTLIQHHNNTGILNEAQKLNIDTLHVNFEVPTLNNEYGGLSAIELFKKIILCIFSIFKLRKKLRYHSYDILVAHDITSLFYLISIPAKKRVLMLHTQRFYKIKFSRLLVNLWSRLSGVVFIAPSNNIVNGANSINSKIKCKLICTPVFKTNPLIIKHDEFLKKWDVLTKYNFKTLKFCYIGRITKMKNLIDAVKFIEFLNNSGFNAELDIYGKSFTKEQKIYEDKLRNEISSSLYKEKIKMCGLTTNPVSTFCKYDFSLIFSDGEAIPLAGLESFAAGTPVIGYNVGGINELISSRRGIIFNKLDFKKFIDDLILFSDQAPTEIYEDLYNYLDKFTLKEFKRLVIQIR